MAIDSRVPRQSAMELAERVRQYPELQAHIEEYLDVVENCDGDVAKADEAEHRLIELMREMGRSGMQAWAERKSGRVEKECDKQKDMVRREKKGSIGTRRSEI